MTNAIPNQTSPEAQETESAISAPQNLQGNPSNPDPEKEARILAYEEKKERRIDRLIFRASAKKRAGEGLLNRAKHIASFIPMGQPILVGHHSEKRHRKDLSRMDSLTRNGIASLDEAERLESRAYSAAENTAIFSDDPQAGEKLEEKIKRLEKQQAIMKEVNKRIRSGKSLLDLGYSAEAEAALRKPDFVGRIGFPNYKLTNNNANIRRLKQRLGEVQKKEATPTPEDLEINGIRIVENADENRLQMFFPGKPSDAIRDQLKSYGFRWSPFNGCWQRHRSNAATYYAKQIAGAAV